MTSFTSQIDEYIERYRKGDSDDAFHGMLEMDHKALPELEARFRAATDTSLRVFLLKVIWQQRQESIVPLLREAVLDSATPVWREALDGLVALASPTSLEALRAGRERHFPKLSEREEYSRWLEEAIEQTETAIE